MAGARGLLPAGLVDKRNAKRLRAALVDLREAVPASTRLQAPSTMDLALARADRALRALRRWLRREGPALAVGLSVTLVALMFLFDFIGGGAKPLLEEADEKQRVAVSLGEHLVAALLVGTVGFYLLVEWKPRRALKKRRAAIKPEGDPVVRRRRAALFAEGVVDPRERAVGIIHGRTGTGRTAFLAMLREQLARKRRVPVTVHLGDDGVADLQKQAFDAFSSEIEPHLRSDEKRDVIWRRAKMWGDIVVIVDEIDDDQATELWKDDGEALRREVTSLADDGIAVVLATTRGLPLDGLVTIREDLDRFTRSEAEKYLERNSQLDADKRSEALRAVAVLRDPVKESLVSPFYLELIAGLRCAIGTPPANRDLWRHHVLRRYVDALSNGEATSRHEMLAAPATVEGGGAHTADDEHASDAATVQRLERARLALDAAEALAGVLRLEQGELGIRRKRLNRVSGRAIAQAADFRLMRRRGDRVGFSADDLGAFLVAQTLATPDGLIEAVTRIAREETQRGREDRNLLITVVFWALAHPEQSDALLTELIEGIDGSTRPAVVAAAIRVATTCGDDRHDAKLASLASACIDAVRRLRRSDKCAWKRDELIKLVRALGAWQAPVAQALLFSLARSGEAGLDWPAARALAATGDLDDDVRETIKAVLLRAASARPHELSAPEARLGHDVTALAWILPSLRERCADEYDAIVELCLHSGISPLRGEIALAQGLKLGVMNKRSFEDNFRDALRLLKLPRELSPSVRSWHARVVLVQATLAHVWLNVEPQEKESRASELDGELGRLVEPHRLVRNAVKLVREGLQVSTDPHDKDKLDSYIWIHEREVVSWVGLGRDELVQLAADTVLLNNMIYELRLRDRAAADRAALIADLPSCICSGARDQIAQTGCDCGQDVCCATSNPALDGYAPFEESFCREQARIARRRGTPEWVGGGRGSRNALESFWRGQAQRAAAGRRSN